MKTLENVFVEDMSTLGRLARVNCKVNLVGQKENRELQIKYVPVWIVEFPANAKLEGYNMEDHNAIHYSVNDYEFYYNKATNILKALY